MKFKSFIQVFNGKIQIRDYNKGYEINFLDEDEAMYFKSGSIYDDLEVVLVEAYVNSILTIYVK